MHPKVPAGFGGRLRGKGPQQRDLAAQPILLDFVLAEHGRGVVLIDDQKAVEELAARIVPTKRSAIAFARGARTGVLTMWMSMAVNTASKVAVNLLGGWVVGAG